MNFSSTYSLLKEYNLYQYLSEQYQLKKYRHLVKKYLPGISSNLCNEESFKKELKSRALMRRTVSDSIVVAGFGTNDDWRRNGIWDAFRKVTDFYLYEVPDGDPSKTIYENDEMKKKQEGFLSFIDTLEKTRKVSIAFFSHSGRHICDELILELHKRGIWTVVMSVDDKHQFIRPVSKVTGEPHQLRIAPKVDAYWTNWQFGCEIVRSLGGNPIYMPEGANPNFHKPLNIQHDLDVVFIGSNYGYRQKLITYLTKMGINVAAYGYGWPNGPVNYDEMVTLFNRAKIVLGMGGVGRTTKINHLKGRDFEVPMCGSVYLTNFNPELADCFVIGQEIMCYGSFEECFELINIILRNQELMTSIQNAARNKCIAQHTWVQRTSKLLNLLVYEQ